MKDVTRYSQVRELMEVFDFARAARVMRLLNWRWTSVGVPSQPDLRRTARRLLEEVSEKDGYRISSGGFQAERNGDELTLRFVLAERCVEPAELAEAFTGRRARK